MRFILPAAIAGSVILTACVDQSFFVKQGVTYDRYERDYVQCSTVAAQKVPVNTQIGWAPYVGIYSTDTNAALRMKNFELCMRDKRYQQVKIPYCSGEKAKAATEQMKLPSRRSTKMKITPQTCYISDPSGRPHLYSPDA
ncbi:hypothetical protein RXV86_09180 [Alisedimentitalea sp. MJ-SS2]|nr:hypothetical protein [Alisedimentitalea sp. MJ-SS2]